MGTEELITVTEAAALLETDRSTVKYLIAEDRLTAYRHQPNSKQEGKKLYLSRQAVEKLAGSDWRRRAKRS